MTPSGSTKRSRTGRSGSAASRSRAQSRVTSTMLTLPGHTGPERTRWRIIEADHRPDPGCCSQTPGSRGKKGLTMTLHRLTSVTMGVPNVTETAGYYTEFGLRPEEDGWFATRDGGRQLRVVPAPSRRLVELRVGVDDPDDLDRVAASLARLGVAAGRGPGCLTAVEPATGVR